MKLYSTKLIFLLLVWAVAALVFGWIQLNPPKLNYTYLADQLSTKIENGEVRGFFAPQIDAAGNRYSWTKSRASLLLNLQTTKPFKLIFNIRSAAVAGGPNAPVQVLLNGNKAGELNPALNGVEFQSITLNLSSPQAKAPMDITLVAERYAPGAGDDRVLGTMIKSIQLDTSEAWETLGKRSWLWWLLPLSGLIALGFQLSGRWSHRNWGHLVAMAALIAGAGVTFLILILDLRVGILDNNVQQLWLWGLIYLIVGFSLTALMLDPVGPNRHSLLTYVTDWLKRKPYVVVGVRGLRNLAGRKIAAWRRALLLLILYAVVALGLLAPSASSDKILPNVYDLPSHVSLIIQARMALDEGQFPLRVGPWQHQGWRYPTYQYYGQLPHTIGGLIYKYLTPDNPYVAYLILLWLSLTLGAFYIYRTCLWLTHSPIGSALAGIVYMASPYFLINIHGRGALAEAVGQGVVPFVLYYSLRCYAKRSVVMVLLGSLSWFLLLASHTITFVFTSIFVALLLMVVAIPRLHHPKTWFRLIRVGLGYLIAWMLGLYYLGPILFYQDNLKIQSLLPDPYTNNALTPISGLLSPSSVPPWPGFADSPGLHPAVGWPMLAAWAVVLYYYLSKGSLRRWPVNLRRTRRYVPVLLALFVLSFFMTWSPVDFWASLPKQLQIVQFTYRMLGQLDWVGALLVPYALVLLVRRLEPVHFVLGALIIGVASSSYLPALKPYNDSVDALIKQPDIGYGGNTYLYYDPKANQIYGNQEFAVDLGAALTTGYALPAWPNGEKPSVLIKGSVTLNNYAESATLNMLVNDQKIAQAPLTQGMLDWEASLEKATPLSKPFNLRFQVEPEGAATVKTSSLVFTHLSPQQTLIPVAQTQGAFHQQGSKTIGQITIEDKFPRIVQLPVLYYPDLLDVRLNGKKVDYTGLHYLSYIMVGLQLPPGTNEISVEFVGLGWANLVSLVAWLLLGMGLFGSLVLAIIKQGRTKNHTTLSSILEEKILVE